MNLLIRLLIVLMTMVGVAWADDNVVNIFNWGQYIPADVLNQFTKETGIKVNYTTYDSDDDLYAKLKINPHGGYDVIFPSSYYVERMAQEGMLHKLSHEKLPNTKYLNPKLLSQSYDPNNQYDFPFAWGTVGIVVNDRFINPRSISRWKDLWSTRFRDRLLLADDVRDIFSVALRALGYSINTRHPVQIQQAYVKLRHLLPNAKLFDANSAQQVYCDDDAYVGVSENGDANEAHTCNPHIRYIYPKDGPIGWMDSVSIPKYAPHLSNAYRFINFIYRPDVGAKIQQYNQFSTPNLAAIKLLPASVRQNPIINPSPNDIKGIEFEGYVGDANPIYEQYWELLRLES
ncbi:MAG: spermidine/putrescine ABC transporter substrate-binding protein [Legionellaceae bacterium]|nr:spermidine/putrescine ABC transporter substrate-binding protein [Legionellaceae bacterium]